MCRGAVFRVLLFTKHFDLTAGRTCLMDIYAECTALFIGWWCHLQLCNNTVASTQTWVQFFTLENLPDACVTTPEHEHIVYDST
jgi:hypothetical protein